MITNDELNNNDAIFANISGNYITHGSARTPHLLRSNHYLWDIDFFFAVGPENFVRISEIHNFGFIDV